jgi:signal transduction histidine kinase
VSAIFDSKGEIVARTGNLVSGEPLDLEPSVVARALDGEVVLLDTHRGEAPYRAVQHPLRDGSGTRYAMVVALSRQPLDVTLDAVAGILILAILVASVLAAFAASRVSRRLTLPLERIAIAARDVGETNLAVRIPEVSSDRELRTVVDLLNDMLGRIEAAFHTQRRFVADASHELRSPLSNLRGTIEVALRHPRSGPEYVETLQVALGEIVRLGRLVEGLLTISRAEARRLVLHPRSLDLVELASAALAAHSARAEERRVGLRLDASAPVRVEGDPDRLREIVDNLLDNALRVAPVGSSVEVAVRREGDRCVVEVKDDGPGLSEDEQARVFEPFARGEAAPGGGAGLGLAIAQRFAEAHGGGLGVRSVPGAGAAFRLELPDSSAG